MSGPVPRRRRGWVILAIWLMPLVGAAFVAIGRQTEAAVLERAVAAARDERSMAEAGRIEQQRRIEELQRRDRVVREANRRLEMHLPADSEIVLVPLPPRTTAGAVHP